jgi:hypothetical protein
MYHQQLYNIKFTEESTGSNGLATEHFSGSIISQEEWTTPEFKMAKDRVTVMLGGNAEGDKN